jgi:hypothetical protein
LLTIRSGVCVVLIVLVAACGRALPSKPSEAGPQPVGIPAAFGWDGVDNRMMMCFTFGVAVDVQPSCWTLKETNWESAPAPPITGHLSFAIDALVYDPERRREVLVAALEGAVPQVWEWDGRSWRMIVTAHHPNLQGGRVQTSRGAYSPELGEVVEPNLGMGYQTWLYDGTDWSSIPMDPPVNSPGGTGDVEYDATRHSIVALSFLDYRTWAFDGKAWKPIPLRGGSSPQFDYGMGRQGPVVSLDEQRGQWVVFGGFDGVKGYSDTWIGDVSTWTKASPVISPRARHAASLAWDPSTHRLLLFGGEAFVNAPPYGYNLSDTWAWDGNQWSQVAGPVYPIEPPSHSNASPAPASAPRLSSPTP